MSLEKQMVGRTFKTNAECLAFVFGYNAALEDAESTEKADNSAMDAITAIEGAIRIVDLWLPKVASIEHGGECEALHEMYRAFLKVTQQHHQ